MPVKVSVHHPSLSLFDRLIRPGQILSTDGGVLIIDQICLVIPDPRQFPDLKAVPNGFERGLSKLAKSTSTLPNDQSTLNGRGGWVAKKEAWSFQTMKL